MEVPAWTIGLALVASAHGVALRAFGGGVAALAVGALVASTYAVKRQAGWDVVVRSERRRADYRRDLAAARAAAKEPDDPEVAEDGRAALAEDDARRRLSGLSDADLHASIRAAAWPDEVAARAVIEGRWGDVVARSIELRYAGIADWPQACARLDEAWFRAQASGG